MKKFLFILLVFALLFSCDNSKESTTKLSHLIPENASLVIKINDLQTFKSDLKNNDFINKLSSTKPSKDLLQQFEILDHIKTNSQILICFETNEDKPEYSIITKYHDSLFNNLEIDSLNIYSKITDSIYVGSTSKVILDNIKLYENSMFESLSEITTNTSSFSIFMTQKSSNSIGNSILLEDMSYFTNLISLDTEISPDQIAFNGVAFANDTLPQLLKVFKNTIPQENTIQNITPSNSNGFLSLTFDDFGEFNLNLIKFNKPDSIPFNITLFDNIIEVGVIYEDIEKAVVLNSIDVISTKDVLLSEQSLATTYRQIDIYNFTNPELFSQTFNPFITFNKVSKYCIIDNFFVFGDSIETLQNIITNFQNGTTFANSSAFKNTMVSLSDESSLLVFANPTKLKTIISSIANEDITNLKLNDYKASAIQFVQDDSFIHINGIIKKHKSSSRQNSISEEFNVVLESDILMQPHFVTNHRTKQKEIVVQDINNNLYLISNGGKVLWKKRLQGPVLGKIEQIDIYKNGRLQLAFATPNRVYVLDRLGRDVSPFPGKFNDEITQPLSVFDYDNTKNYRLLVTQGSYVLMYDVNSKLVKGFTFKSATNNINHQPQHFRIGRKDYILIKTENKLHILDRTGRTRITPKTSSTYSNEAVYIYKDKFTTTSKKGNLITIDTKGKYCRSKFKSFTTTSYCKLRARHLLLYPITI